MEDYFIISFILLSYFIILYAGWAIPYPILDKILGTIILTGFFGFLFVIYYITVNLRDKYHKNKK